MPMDAKTTDLSRLASLPLLDDAAIDALRDPELGGEPEFLAEVVDAFLGDTPPRIATIRESLASSDGIALSRAAHSLKGSSGNFGAQRLQTICADLERLGREGHLEHLAPLVAQVEIEYQAIASRLRELVAEATGSSVVAHGQ